MSKSASPTDSSDKTKPPAFNTLAGIAEGLVKQWISTHHTPVITTPHGMCTATQLADGTAVSLPHRPAKAEMYGTAVTVTWCST